jgi:hypothetical protein
MFVYLVCHYLHSRLSDLKVPSLPEVLLVNAKFNLQFHIYIAKIVQRKPCCPSLPGGPFIPGEPEGPEGPGGPVIPFSPGGPD